MELHLWVIRKSHRTLLKRRQRLLVIAFFVEDPTKSIGNYGFGRQQFSGLLGEIIGLVELAKTLG